MTRRKGFTHVELTIILVIIALFAVALLYATVKIRSDIREELQEKTEQAQKQAAATQAARESIESALRAEDWHCTAAAYIAREEDLIPIFLGIIEKEPESMASSYRVYLVCTGASSSKPFRFRFNPVDGRLPESVLVRPGTTILGRASLSTIIVSAGDIQIVSDPPPPEKETSQ